MVGKDALQYQGALTAAVGKAFPVYSKKTTEASRKGEDESKENSRKVHMALWDEKGAVLACPPDATTAALAAAQGIQLGS